MLAVTWLGDMVSPVFSGGYPVERLLSDLCGVVVVACVGSAGGVRASLSRVRESGTERAGSNAPTKKNPHRCCKQRTSHDTKHKTPTEENTKSNCTPVNSFKHEKKMDALVSPPNNAHQE